MSSTKYRIKQAHCVVVNLFGQTNFFFHTSGERSPEDALGIAAAALSASRRYSASTAAVSKRPDSASLIIVSMLAVAGRA